MVNVGLHVLYSSREEILHSVEAVSCQLGYAEVTPTLCCGLSLWKTPSDFKKLDFEPSNTYITPAVTCLRRK